MTLRLGPLDLQEFKPAGPSTDGPRIASGVLTLVAGSASESVPGFTTNATVMVQYASFGGGLGSLRGAWTAGNVVITSSSGTDTSTVNYWILEG